MNYNTYEVTAYFHTGGSMFLGIYEAKSATDAEDKAFADFHNDPELQGFDYQLEATII